ncbi:uncharacterized protein [Misgurnus anguillicaudatus]|uniref:uncharacterized protein n=1 Tax=Misgurnus anguillicaudatus TaxID=75329 RepID=UPI003CCF6DE9
MMLLRLNLFGMLMLWCCWLMHVKGQDVCQSNLTQRINLTTELQSEILLSCYFGEAFIKTNQTPNASVVWTHIYETSRDIVEVPVSGEAKFWNSRQGRIKAFSHISGSGNFSILIKNVTKSDLGLYQCKLYRDSNCFQHYMEINISLAPMKIYWQLLLGGGGFLLVCLIPACAFYTWTKRQTVPSSHDGHNSDGQTFEQTDEITYASVVHRRNDSNALMSENNTSTPESDLLNSETDVLYATVKERGRQKMKD